MAEKIFHFFHLWIGGIWKQVVIEHFGYLKESKLINNLSGLYIGLVGNKEGREEAKILLNTFGVPFEIVCEKNEGFEQETLDKMYEFSLLTDGFCLYAHNKACYHQGPAGDAWRKSMSYYNIIKWRESISHLKDHHASGVYLLTPERFPGLVKSPFYGGNFMIVRLDYFRTLGYPKRESRYSAESHIGTNKDFKGYSYDSRWPSMEVFVTKW